MAQTRDILTSPRAVELKRRQRAARLRILLLFTLLFVCIIIGLSVLSGYRKIRIDTVVVTGTRIINADDVKEKVEADLAGNYLHLFSRSNSLIYPRRHIYADILKTFTRTETLNISLENVRTLHIDISERAGSYLWCGATLPEVKSDVGENCYFVNNDGYIFDKAPYFSGNVYFKFYIPLDTAGTPLGKQMLTPDEFHSLMRFSDIISSAGLKPIYSIFNSDGTRELYLEHAEPDSAPKIVWKADSDLEKIGGDLVIAMSKPEFKEEILSKYAKLLYIDLRFNNKVLYKFQ